MILVAYDQALIALEFRIYPSGLARVMHLLVRATLPNFAFLADFCPVARPCPRGTASSQRDSMPNSNARDQRGYQGLCIKAWLDQIATKANPGPLEMAGFANFGILTPRGDSVAPRCQGVLENQVA